MDDGARGWLYKTCRKNFWRVAVWMDFDDLLQDGYLTFYRIKAHYRHVTEKAHLMPLFQVSFLNHLNDLATQRTRSSFEVPIADVFVRSNALHDTKEKKGSPWDNVVAVDNTDLMMLVAHAPSNVKAALSALANADGETLREPYRKTVDGRRETLNERLCKLANLDPKTDLLGDVRGERRLWT